MEPANEPLEPSEFDVYNRLSNMMQTFHNHFRRTWKRLQDSTLPPVDGPPKMTDDQIVREGLFFCYRLTNHHNIEERSLFPMLAQKMPEFRGDNALLLEQHREIHHGLEDLQQYLEKCRSRKTKLDLAILRSKMEPWGHVLLLHLDLEVEMLGAENMRKYWTREEMLGMPV
ncbi:Protein bfr2 [Colletotrichum asianum]